MENIETNEVQNQQIELSQEINGYLKETSKWGKFLAIMGYIGMGILVLIGLFMTIGFSFANHLIDQKFPMGMIGLIYIVLAAIYLIPITYLYRFSTQIKKGIITNESTTITSGFRNLKSLFKFMGILTIVILSIYLLIILAAVPLMLLMNQ